MINFQIQLVLPLLLYTLYILLFYFYLGYVRARSVKAGTTSIKYFKAYNSNEIDPKVLVVGRHLENQFELPILFFILNIIVFNFNLANSIFTILAWSFVVSRFFHSYIHLTSNSISLRRNTFSVGLLVLIIQTFLLMYFVLNLKQ